jgi:hypothetical protein
MKSPTPPKPAFPDQLARLLADLPPGPRRVLLGGLVFFFLMAASTTLLLAYMVYQPQITAWLQRSSSGPSPASVSQLALPTPTSQSLLSIPTSQPVQPSQLIISTSTPSCSSASLRIGTHTWQVAAIHQEADGSISVPANTPGTAYWVSDLHQNSVFALSPTRENLDILNATQGGEEVTITWENCNSSTYTLFTIATGIPNAEILHDQKLVGLVVYVPENSLGPGLTVQGALAGETITVPPTGAPSLGEVEAEISLLETSTSQDQKTLQVVISILNYGSNPITLTSGDVSLTPQGDSPLQISGSDPQLPEQIDPGASQEFTLVFPRPSAATAILKIFTVEYDLEEY